MLTSIYGNSDGCDDYMSKYATYLCELLQSVSYESLAKVVDLMLDTRGKGGVVYLAGNGGSASTASHLSQDFAEVTRKAQTDTFRALSFCDNLSKLTALANDFGYDDVFKIQVEEAVSEKDMLVVFSASGNSENVIRAVEAAKAQGAPTVAFLGFDGGKLKELADHVVLVSTPPKEYGPVEDAHLIFGHMIVHYLIDKLS